MKKLVAVIATSLSVVNIILGNTALAATFGTYCQQEYENDWQDETSQTWRHCSRFNNELDDTDTRVFYRNLHSARDEFEADNDQNGLERVDLAYVVTHGGVSAIRAWWDMWDDSVRAFSSNMWLGNENHGLSILASYACDTHRFADGNNIWTRWRNPFKGGLRYTVGSHDLLYSGRRTNECGDEFADNLQDGDVVKYAWKKAVRESGVDQDATAIASGRDSEDCHLRRDNMTWQNFSTYPRRRDNDMNHICWTWWENL